MADIFRRVTMKSYFLEELHDNIAAEEALTESLPGQARPWVIWTSGRDDVVAYLNVCEETKGETPRGPFVIQADISGRHYHDDQKVIEVLCRLQERLGGTIRNDDDEVVG
ncbi:hypothetical protein FZC33_00295 [Labrys sp. KNU-23]|uniref:hypothetical protein n=1 Tax=Labrys sp. KNU-23 TaxID=2789216 RepID=UPI0011EBC04C|nr:hypothetical protein [Labrys sp. KNU-23]QEN84767.1 hypothetical protein FZC33_00295 [Labrys sp. KNU-23]